MAADRWQGSGARQDVARKRASWNDPQAEPHAVGQRDARKRASWTTQPAEPHAVGQRCNAAGWRFIKPPG